MLFNQRIGLLEFINLFLCRHKAAYYDLKTMHEKPFSFIPPMAKRWLKPNIFDQEIILNASPISFFVFLQEFR